jgi:hypothetical protein
VTVPARISIVTLGVADLARSVAFYEALGWERAAASNAEIAWFHTADTSLGLFPLSHLAADVGVAAPPAGEPHFRGVTLAINVETEAAVESALAAAVEAGGSLLKPATRAEWGGLSGYFADPDGYAWEVAFNPFFPISEDGRVRID